MLSKTAKHDAYNTIKQLFKEIDWDKFEDLDRAINWELFYGPLGEYDYWHTVEPLEHYDWQGFEQASKDMVELLEPLPHHIYLDEDGEVYLKNPEDDSSNWRFECMYCKELLHEERIDGKLVYVDDTDGDCCSGNEAGENENETHQIDDKTEAIWWGPELFFKEDTRKFMMFEESWKQLF